MYESPSSTNAIAFVFTGIQFDDLRVFVWDYFGGMSFAQACI
jgi:hypothetical protein